MSEMKKYLTFVFSAVFCLFCAGAVARDANTMTRGQTKSVVKTQNTRSISNRSAVNKTVSARTVGSVTTLKPRTATTQSVATRTPVNTNGAKNQRDTIVKKQNVSVRAAIQTGNGTVSETRTGTEYEQCKTAFFTCMDQFCQLKNDNFRRCSCSDKVFEYQEKTEKYQDISTRLTEFAENLDIVGMTKEQAIAMKTATEGEDALTEDKSSSKQLLQAIMNAIKGEDSSVGGKYQSLNSIAPLSDVSNPFGTGGNGQIIAAYNGVNLYKAVYPQCRNAIKSDCTDASLQRAVNAYLMAIEQDCNTVASALSNQQKALKTTNYESSAMLDLARVENRKKHNSSDIAKCISDVEKAIQSNEVCGLGYYKCLDNGQYIDVTTGEPLTGVQDFYKLGEQLTFVPDRDIQNQKLSEILANNTFITFFENKTKKFAKDALDKCTEKSEEVWKQYLDRALLDIYYAQQSKVKTIRDDCFKLVSACYKNQKTAIQSGMANIDDDYSIYLGASVANLSQQMCNDYINSCNSMFAGDVVKAYIDAKTQSDSDDSCRTIAQNCFDSFGGTNFENFYSLQNGVIERDKAIDWFTLYDYTENGKVLSLCAQELVNTNGCNDAATLERVFGGVDKFKSGDTVKYTSLETQELPDNATIADAIDRHLRPTGVATEVYNKIVNILTTQCEQVHGGFVPAQYAEYYGYNPANFCQIGTENTSNYFYKQHPSSSCQSVGATGKPENTLNAFYHFKPNENMCPAGYMDKIDIQSWGICSCWENGRYRSKNGTIATCKPILPMRFDTSDMANIGSGQLVEEGSCTEDKIPMHPEDTIWTGEGIYYPNQWCTNSVFDTSSGVLCPTLYLKEKNCALESNSDKPICIPADNTR